MNSTEHILHCAYRQGYVDHFKWQLVPIVGAGSSLIIATVITAIALSALFSYDLSINHPIKISEKKHDLTVLFLNAIGNLLTAGILNAVLIRVCSRSMMKSCSEMGRNDSRESISMLDEDDMSSLTDDITTIDRDSEYSEIDYSYESEKEGIDEERNQRQILCLFEI